MGSGEEEEVVGDGEEACISGCSKGCKHGPALHHSDSDLILVSVASGTKLAFMLILDDA